MSATPDYIQTFNEFWHPLVTDEHGRVDMDKIMRELHDYHTCLQEVPKVYRAITDNKFSKPTTDAMYIVSAVDEFYHGLYHRKPTGPAHFIQG